MENWLILSIVCAVLFGLLNFGIKVLASKTFMGADVRTSLLFMAVGIAIVFWGYFLFGPKETGSAANSSTIVFAIVLGATWAVGAAIIFWAISGSADISRMAPIFNLNTLIVVFLAIFLLREIPDNSAWPRIIIGTILSIIGVILVSI